MVVFSMGWSMVVSVMLCSAMVEIGSQVSFSGWGS